MRRMETIPLLALVLACASHAVGCEDEQLQELEEDEDGEKECTCDRHEEFAGEDVPRLQPLTNFALGLMAVTVGAHLNVRRLRNAGKRLFYLLITESLVTP